MSTTYLIKRALRRLPLVEPLWRARQRRQYFAGREGHPHFGHFDSFEAARRWLPPSPEFDTEALRSQYEGVRTTRIFAYDYPVLHWLRQAFDEGCSGVLDIGGSVGVHALAYRRYLRYPQDWQWTVVEVPAMVTIGRELAAREGLAGLRFQTELDEAALQAPVWLSAGAIHYLPSARPSALLDRAASRPRWILLNKLPLYDGPDYVSTQRLAPGVFAPHHVYQRERLIRDIEARGYELVDHWAVLERSLYLPGHPDCDIPAYTGLCFRRKD